MLGSFAVGKTSLVSRFVTGIFTEKYQSTVGVKIDKKKVLYEGSDVNLIVWDLHGEDEFQKISTRFLRGSSGLIYVADGTRPSTFNTALKIRERAKSIIGEIPHVVVLNKSDLESEWNVDQNQLERITKEGVPSYATSAKNSSGVEDTFDEITRQVMVS